MKTPLTVEEAAAQLVDVMTAAAIMPNGTPSPIWRGNAIRAVVGLVEAASRLEPPPVISDEPAPRLYTSAEYAEAYDHGYANGHAVASEAARRTIKSFADRLQEFIKEQAE